MCARGRDAERLECDGLRYIRHRSDHEGITRGTVALLAQEGGAPAREVQAFPSIARVYCLDAGLARCFGDRPFFVEEKVDGYNARLLRHEGRLIALTRGGFICPFTTEWAARWAERFDLHRFFDEHPRRVLCGEVVGDNPYNAQRDRQLPPGAHILFFDVMDEAGQMMAPEERHALLDSLGLPTAPRYGQRRREEIDALRRLMLELDARGREGVVMKSLDGQQTIKYVTPGSNLEDIRDAMLTCFDLPARYVVDRMLRITTFVQELGLDREEYDRRIGAAVLDGLAPLRSYAQSSESFVIHVRDQRTWEALAETVSPRVKVELDGMTQRRIDGHELIEVRFRRVYRKSTGRFHSVLKGFPHRD